MISGVAFLCIHAQIKNTVVPQTSIGLMVRPKMMCGKQQHVPSSTESSDGGNSVAFSFGLTGKHAVLFPGCHWCESWTRAGKEKALAFFCVYATSLLCRQCSETRHAVRFASGVLCWHHCFPKSDSEQEKHRRKKPGFQRLASRED